MSNAAVSWGGDKPEKNMKHRTYLEFRQTIIDFHVTVLDSSCQIYLLDEQLECTFRAPLVHTIDNTVKRTGDLTSELTDAQEYGKETSEHQRLISPAREGKHPRLFAERRPGS